MQFHFKFLFNSASSEKNKESQFIQIYENRRKFEFEDEFQLSIESLHEMHGISLFHRILELFHCVWCDFNHSHAKFRDNLCCE